MFFTVHKGGWLAGTRSQAFLLIDNWDDYSYKTNYLLIFYDAEGKKVDVGEVKIGQFQMKENNQLKPNIPDAFDELNEKFFSLGQDDSYYENLNELGEDIRDKILHGLQDVAIDRGRFERAFDEQVTTTSLLRFIPRKTVETQYARLAQGGARLSRYKFTYAAPKARESKAEPVKLSFVVEPESMPPTNIHVLIGRNGVGKTHLLNNMSRSLTKKHADAADVGVFTVESDGSKGDEEDLFASLVSVTFSAFDPFDPFEPLPDKDGRSEGVPYDYIGLKMVRASEKGGGHKSLEDLSKEFSDSVHVCCNGARLTRWRKALNTLVEADPVFQTVDVASLANENPEDGEFKTKAKTLFDSLSSGHKIVLLTITKLVETVTEQTLVLLDEPEVHLHPPLLSAFIRALSDLLVNRNGVAIIATHSPVVLQEVPRSCAWKIQRSGCYVVAKRPDSETFGENVGVLTREVFGLDVTKSGFHQMLRTVVADGKDFRAVLQEFNDHLGGEARALVMALIANRQPAKDSE